MYLDDLIEAIVRVESGGDLMAIGDKNLRYHAYGCMQIRQPAMDDYNRWCGTQYAAEDCLGDRPLSEDVFREYIAHYATRTRLKREPTEEDMARIWNGGTKGHLNPLTAKYWVKVKRELEKIAVEVENEKMAINMCIFKKTTR